MFESIKKAFASKGGDDRATLSKKIQASPNDPQVRQKLGLFMLRAGEVVEGIDQLARAAIIYEKDGFAGKAVAVVRQIIKHDPKSNDFQKWLIRLLATEGLFADAYAEINRIAGEPNRFNSDDHRIDFLRQLSDFLKDSPLPYILISDIFISNRKRLEAASELKKAVLAKNASEMRAEIAGRIRTLSGQGESDFSILEICGFMYIAIGMKEEGMSLLARVIGHEGEMGNKVSAAEKQGILNLIREGKDLSGAGVFSFTEVANKQNEKPAPSVAKAADPKATVPKATVPRAASPKISPVPEEDPVMSFGIIEDIGEASVETPAETPIETPIEMLVETPVEMPIETLIEKSVEKPIEKPLIKKPVEKPVEMPVEMFEEMFEETPEELSEEEEEEYVDEDGDEDLVQDALGRLQAKVHEEIGEADLETRYNLGIAYKEMGLLNEAANEFRLSMKNPYFLVGAASLLADTLAEKGDVEGALVALEEALGGSATETQLRDLEYQKATMLSLAGREKEAGNLFVAIAKKFPGYRDVDDKAKQYL